MKKPKFYSLSMKVLFALMLFYAVSGAKAQVASDEVRLANDVILNDHQIEFDIYIKSTNTAGFPNGFPYGNGQFRINFNNGIRNGANTQIFFEIIAGSSELTNAAQVNNAVTNPTLTQSFCRLPARFAVPYADASIISPDGNGTKVVRMRMTSRDNTTQAAVPFVANSLANLALSTSSPGFTATSYSAPSSMIATCTPQVLNNTLLTNAPLNPITPPTAFAVTGGGSYCWYENGVPVGLAGSEIGVNYTLLPGGMVMAGTGVAISFGNQLFGTYTISGTNQFGTTDMTGNAVIYRTPPTVTPTFTQLGPYELGEAPAALPGTSLNGVSGTWSPAIINTLNVGSTTYYFYPDCCQCSDTASMTIAITAMPVPVASTWNGSVSSDWFNAANWTNTPAVVAYPGTTTQVTIPGGTLPNYLTLTETTSCASFTIQSGGSFIGSEFLSVTGESKVFRVIPDNKYHFMSSPVRNTTWEDVFSGNLLNVWVKWWYPPHNKWYYYSTTYPSYGAVPGQGSAVLTTASPLTAEFKGILNNNHVVCNNLSNANGGFNLLGNPFQSAIAWDNVVKGAGISPVVKVWNGTTYLDYSSALQTGSFDGLIPAENGFFVSTTVNNDYVTVPLAARTHGNPATFYKSAVNNLLRIDVNGNELTDATFIHFNNDATSAFDSQFDGIKLWGESYCPQVYSMISDNRLSINELPMEGNEVVDLGFRCDSTGEYNVTVSNMESFDANTPIILEDIMLSKTQNLRQNPVYTFSHASGDVENRFRLHFKSSTGTGDLANGGIVIYSLEKSVVITNATQLAGEVWIYDVAGRELVHSSMSNQDKTTIPVNAAIGVYMVKVTTAKGSVNQKVFIR